MQRCGSELRRCEFEVGRGTSKVERCLFEVEGGTSEVPPSTSEVPLKKKNQDFIPSEALTKFLGKF